MCKGAPKHCVGAPGGFARATSHEPRAPPIIAHSKPYSCHHTTANAVASPDSRQATTAQRLSFLAGHGCLASGCGAGGRWPVAGGRWRPGVAPAVGGRSVAAAGGRWPVAGRWSAGAGGRPATAGGGPWTLPGPRTCGRPPPPQRRVALPEVAHRARRPLDGPPTGSRSRRPEAGGRRPAHSAHSPDDLTEQGESSSGTRGRPVAPLRSAGSCERRRPGWRRTTAAPARAPGERVTFRDLRSAFSTKTKEEPASSRNQPICQFETDELS